MMEDQHLITVADHKKIIKGMLVPYVEEIARLKGRLEEISEAYVATMNEVCEESDDRQHCTCVPFLREEVDRLKAEVQVLRDDEKDCEDCPELARMGQEINRLKGKVEDLERELVRLK